MKSIIELHPHPVSALLTRVNGSRETAVDVTRALGMHFADSQTRDLDRHLAEEANDKFNIQIDSTVETALNAIVNDAGVNNSIAPTVKAVLIHSSLDLSAHPQPRSMTPIEAMEEFFDKGVAWSGEGLDWELRWGELSAIRKSVEPAYLAALCPALVQAIMALPPWFVTVLTVGGGRGHFGWVIKPALKALLETQDPRIVLATETDIHGAIQDAPTEHSQTSVESLGETFSKRKRHIVFGENMIHYAERSGLSQWIKQIKSALDQEHGVFIHVRDNIPDATLWAPKEIYDEYGWVLTPGITVGSAYEADREAHEKIAKAAHDGLKEGLAEAATENGLYSFEKTITASPELPCGDFPIASTNISSRNNYCEHTSKTGVRTIGYAPWVQEGYNRFEYTGILTFVSSDYKTIERLKSA